MRHMSCVMYHVSHVNNATATDPLSANSSTMNNRLVPKKTKTYFFPWGNYRHLLSKNCKRLKMVENCRTVENG